MPEPRIILRAFEKLDWPLVWEIFKTGFFERVKPLIPILLIFRKMSAY